MDFIVLHGCIWWHSWLRHCTTSRKVTGSIPNGVMRIVHWHNPSCHIMALGSTQPLTEMSTTNIPWGGKGGQCIVLTTLPPSCADCLEIWKPQPPGSFRAFPGPYKGWFTFYSVVVFYNWLCNHYDCWWHTSPNKKCQSLRSFEV